MSIVLIITDFFFLFIKLKVNGSRMSSRGFWGLLATQSFMVESYTLKSISSHHIQVGMFQH